MLLLLLLLVGEWVEISAALVCGPAKGVVVSNSLVVILCTTPVGGHCHNCRQHPWMGDARRGGWGFCEGHGALVLEMFGVAQIILSCWL